MGAEFRVPWLVRNPELFLIANRPLNILNPAPKPKELWCLTSFYNPVGYKRLANNYELFARSLKAQGGRLLTVEMRDDEGKYWLDDRLADIHLKIDSGDVMFQKEKLLNYGASQLPESCDALCWIDCDMLYENSDWLDQICDKLSQFQTTQAFKRFCRMPENSLKFDVESCGAARIKDSVVKKTIEKGTAKEGYPAPGGVWAARRDFFEQIGGLYQYDIVGGGDVVFAGAMLGADTSKRYSLSGVKEAAEYIKRVNDVAVGGVGYIEADVCHLWHGEDQHRQYITRYNNFLALGYEPALHLNNSGPSFKWTDAAPTEMKKYLRDYFIYRREDG